MLSESTTNDARDALACALAACDGDGVAAVAEVGPDPLEINSAHTTQKAVHAIRAIRTSGIAASTETSLRGHDGGPIPCDAKAEYRRRQARLFHGV